MTIQRVTVTWLIKKISVKYYQHKSYSKVAKNLNYIYMAVSYANFRVLDMIIDQIKLL